MQWILRIFESVNYLIERQWMNERLMPKPSKNAISAKKRLLIVNISILAPVHRLGKWRVCNVRIIFFPSVSISSWMKCFHCATPSSKCNFSINSKIATSPQIRSLCVSRDALFCLFDGFVSICQLFQIC